MQNWTSQIYLREDKIYRGAYNYFRNENVYAEETFDVYRNKKDLTQAFISEATIRLSTGEILKINVEYIINKDSVPTYVFVERAIGKEFAREVYTYNNKSNHLEYHFSSSQHGEKSDIIPIAPRYHITTPTTASSMVFMRTKKFDANGRNTYNILSGINIWEYKETPTFKIITLERASFSLEKIVIDGQSVLATQYKIFENQPDHHETKDLPHIKVFLSQHGTIPYIIKTDDGTKIQIKYFNDLLGSE